MDQQRGLDCLERGPSHRYLVIEKRTGVRSAKLSRSRNTAILSADSRMGALNPLLDQNVPETDNQHPGTDLTQ
jgi:hypothetical protein